MAYVNNTNIMDKDSLTSKPIMMTTLIHTDKAEIVKRPTR